MDELTKKKISAKLKGRKKLATHKKKISQSLKGRKLTEEHKKKISEAMKQKRQFQPITIRLGNPQNIIK